MQRVRDLISAAEVLESKLDPSIHITGITSDSREAFQGKLFFAIPGFKLDGHDYLVAALAQGATGVVVERKESYKKFPNTILVPSVRVALAKAASRWFSEPSKHLKIVAVTGTNGKTTTTFLLQQIWTALGFLPGVIGTVSAVIGNRTTPSSLTTPDAISLQRFLREMVDAEVTHAAIEVSSIALDQERALGTHFQAAIFTNLTQDHLDYHRDFESYYQAKLKLFRDYQIPVGIFNVDCEWGIRLRQEATVPRKVGISLKGNAAEYQASQIQLEKGQTIATFATPQGEFKVSTPLIGEHNIYNLLGVVAALVETGIPIAEVFKVIGKATGAPGRLERVAAAENRPFVFVDYAHTPDALENVLRALQNLRARSGAGKIITVFGCGGDRDRAKRPMMAKIACALSDIIVATSDNPRTESPEKILDDVETGIVVASTPQFFRESNRRAAIFLALSKATPDDLVLVAGKGHETYQIIGTTQIPFDDRAVIRDYYSQT